MARLRGWDFGIDERVSLPPNMKRNRSTARLMPRLSSLGVFAVLALAGMHLPLLAQRLSDASISRPGVLLRWLLVPVLVAAFAVLRHRGHSLVRGRAALVLWLLVLLLHAAPATTADGSHDLLLLPPVAVGALGTVVWIVAVALRSVRKTARAEGASRRRSRAPLAFALPASPLFGSAAFAPRPPPVPFAPRFV